MGRVGEYEMGKTIACGAFSKVKLVLHEPTGKQYVAKILPKTNKDVETDVRVEISILRRVRHENVVQLIEILESPRHYYIILEPVLGGDLCQLVMDAPSGMEEEAAAAVFRQIVLGLCACHHNGVAHRDMKPENILLTPDRQVKISDFGLSRLHKSSHYEAVDSEYARTLTGTLAYVAPEVLSGQYDAFRADLWSIGCILYVMLTSRFPFGGAQGKELERCIAQGLITPLPDHVSDAAKDLVGQLMQMNPKLRPSLDQVLAHPFVADRSNQVSRSVVDMDTNSGLQRVPQTSAPIVGMPESFAMVDPEDEATASGMYSPTLRRIRRPLPS